MEIAEKPSENPVHSKLGRRGGSLSAVQTVCGDKTDPGLACEVLGLGCTIEVLGLGCTIEVQDTQP